MSECSLVIVNANVVTLNPKRPRAEAVAVHDGNIVAVGSIEEIKKRVGTKTVVVDAKNKMVVPGFIDCHVHMTGFGNSFQRLELTKTVSISQLQQKLQEFARKNPDRDWILGRGWDQEVFVEKRHPTRADLDAAVADKPVFLIRVCGHLAAANSKALQIAGITRETTVNGGEVDLDEATGKPNGILRDGAMKLVLKVIPKPRASELEEACILASRKAIEAGLTCVHWLVSSTDEIRAIQKLSLEGRIPLRVYLGVPVGLLGELDDTGLKEGSGNTKVRVGFAKIFADGSLGAHTAALKKPYSDRPDTKGLMCNPETRLNKLVLKAHKAGLQVAVHAIGDQAVETTLTAFQKALQEQPRENHRHRVEHCSVLDSQLITRMKSLSVIASVQPHFIVSDFWVAERVGKERARWVYPFRTLLKKGLTVVFGSDCPVEPINPLYGVWAAVARKKFPEESLTVKEALRAYTSDSAYASFDEHRMGTIEKGKSADFTICSQDLFRITPEEIRDVTVEMVVIQGKIVYSKSRV